MRSSKSAPSPSGDAAVHGIKIRHSLADRLDDLYETPACATCALLDVEDVPDMIWEPACGRGAISSILLMRGKRVFSTDLVNYGYGIAGVDFLMEHKPQNVGAIITNPPFKLADQFVRHALVLCPKVIMLLRLAFLEGSRRTDILDDGRLARVYVFKNRLPMMHRDGWEGKTSTSTTAYAWYCWDRSFCGSPTIHRITHKG